ncbi:MAG: aminotransferase class V-fold PLP-dependent enzyme [Bacillota bacterium]|nr:aminotransferase class V-fold PLP-dependent enzyme [Bacillota bacterium]
MIYLDNAATSYPKPDIVHNEMLRCMREYCANPGRGGHILSNKAGDSVMRVREIISRFFNFDNPLNLCFTKNATEAINIALKGFLKHGDHVITTAMEHNSVLRPLKTMERDDGIELTILRGDRYGRINPEAFRSAVRENTRLIVCTLSSNVNGVIMPVKEIGNVAREQGIAFLVDVSQGAGSIAIDVEDMKIDMLAFPGHKGLLGPQGTGGLYVREGLILKPMTQGGTGSNSENVFQPDFMPDLLESGTINTPGIVGLGCGIDFIDTFGIENLRLYKHMLVQRLHGRLKDIPGVILYSIDDINENSGIVAINIGQLDSNEVSYTLDRKFGIAVRAGLHCSPFAHETLGTLGRGIVRFSIGCFNTFEEIDLAAAAVADIAASCRTY